LANAVALQRKQYHYYISKILPLHREGK